MASVRPPSPHGKHPLEQTFDDAAPRWLRHRYGRRLLAIDATVARFRSLPRDATFTDLARSLTMGVTAHGGLPDGPLVVVANHPCANVDLWALGAAVEAQGRAARAVVDSASRPFEELHHRYVFVGDTPEERDAFWSLAIHTVASGTVLVMFPAGHTNHRLRDGRVVETPWRAGALKVAARAGAVVVPAWVELTPPAWYDRLRRHLPRMAVQPLNLRLLASAPSRVTVRFGTPVAPGDVTPHELQDLVYALGSARRSVMAAPW